MVSDALDEAGIDLGSSQPQAELPFDEQLRRLEALKAEGMVTSAEYETAKKRILDGLGKIIPDQRISGGADRPAIAEFAKPDGKVKPQWTS
jgi:hypothetical protein